MAVINSTEQLPAAAAAALKFTMLPAIRFNFACAKANQLATHINFQKLIWNIEDQL